MLGGGGHEHACKQSRELRKPLLQSTESELVVVDSMLAAEAVVEENKEEDACDQWCMHMVVVSDLLRLQ